MTEYDGVERSTATETFRAMLDERGVKWIPVAWDPKRETFYHAANGVGFCADEYTDGVKIYTDATITPEQAIAATLGPGTCHNLKASWPSLFECDECGYSNDDTYCGSECHFKFCPNCGAKVVGA